MVYKRRKDMVPGDVFWLGDRVLQVLDNNHEIDPVNTRDWCWLGEWSIGFRGLASDVFEMVEEDA